MTGITSFFLLSRALSVMALQMLSTAFVLAVLESGGDAFDLGQLGIAATAATLITAVPLGSWIDHWGREVSLLTSQLLLLLLSLGLWHWGSAMGEPVALIAVVASVAILRNARSISQSSVFGELLERQGSARERWIHASTLCWQVAAILGPLAAGSLKERFGLSSVFGAAALFVALSLAGQLPALARIRAKAGKDRSEPVRGGCTWRELMEFLLSHPRLKWALLLDFGVVFFGSAAAVVPFLNGKESSPVVIGLFRAAPSIGVLIATLGALWKPQAHRWRGGLIVATTGFGVGHLLLAAAPHWWACAILLGVAGFFDGISLSIREVLLQVDAPAAMKSKIYSVNSFLVNASDELGDWESGIASRLLGLRGSLVFGACATFAMSGAFVRWSGVDVSSGRSSRRQDHRKSEAPLQVSS